MSLELVAGYGIRSGGVADLTFGMTRGELRHAVQLHTVVYPTWVCGTTWAERFVVAQADVLVYADENGGLAAFSIEQRCTADRVGEDAAVPAVVDFEGVDVFGHPSGHIIAHLLSAGHDVAEGSSVVGVGPDISLYRRPPAVSSVAGRKPRHQPDPDGFLFDSMSFRATGYDYRR